MKKLTILSALALSIPALFAQDASLISESQSIEGTVTAPQSVTKTTKQEVSESYKKAINDFSNLPEAKRLEFLKKRQEVGTLFKNKRVIEAIELTREISTIFDSDPQVLNLRGACFVELRDFTKATESFKKSMSITGPSLNVLFNIGEVAFISEKWQESLDIFTQALDLAPKKSTDMRQIIEFKIMLSHVALSKSEALSDQEKQMHLAKVAEYAKLYDFLDNSPYYYYASAAAAFSAGDQEKGNGLLGKARRVYADNPAALASWEDTMAEYGYIQSFYGDKK